ncbi:hypothetical protein UFOVP1545_9 [uncultured Caudovirales phage]|jgi:hypothetical protein|uniref:Uncharacterized protein n=1 Tax=uncultured Caudovirales phage TaxID=2100421 RepID=A0A6J7XC31_9CAUD|nr:hypothetical protein UFOVP1545_9 [uncultured Caudovirales phage]
MAIPSRVLASGNSGLATISICGDGATGLVAVGSTQATALQLSAVFNTIATSAASTGVKLPPCEAGAMVYIYNLAGQDLRIYSNGTETLNAAVAGATGVLVGNTKTAICFATSATTWAVTAALSST